jgi:serine/threonine protein kinase
MHAHQTGQPLSGRTLLEELLGGREEAAAVLSRIASSGANATGPKPPATSLPAAAAAAPTAAATGYVRKMPVIGGEAVTVAGAARASLSAIPAAAGTGLANGTTCTTGGAGAINFHESTRNLPSATPASLGRVGQGAAAGNPNFGWSRQPLQLGYDAEVQLVGVGAAATAPAVLAGPAAVARPANIPLVPGVPETVTSGWSFAASNLPQHKVDFELVGLTPVANDVLYSHIVQNGWKWGLGLRGLLGAGAYGVVYEVVGSFSRRLQEAAGNEAEGGVPSVVQLSENSSSSSSSNWSCWSEPHLLALKVPVPYSQLAPSVAAQFSSSDGYLARMQDAYATEAHVLHTATKGQVTPHTIAIFEFGEVQPDGFEEPYPCLLLELASRGSLGAFVEEHYPNGMPSPVAQAMMRKLVHVVSDFHMASQAIHRDIKPQNVLLTGAPNAPLEQLQPKLADCGAARALRGVWDLGYTLLCGTVPYRPPEGDKAGWGQDVRYDVWSLACTLLFLRFNKLPFWYLLEALQLGRRVPGGAPALKELQQRWDNRGEEIDHPSSPYAAEGVFTAEERDYLRKCLSAVPARPTALRLSFEAYIFEGL